MKLVLSSFLSDTVWSRPARALWIEIFSSAMLDTILYVEAREGLVD